MSARFPEPRKWTLAEITQEAKVARELYAARRPSEGRDAYLSNYSQATADVTQLLDDSDDLRTLATALTANPKILKVARYLCAPPISDDDLATVAGHIKSSKTPAAMADRSNVLIAGLDLARFPWLSAGRSATAEEQERAIQTTSALIASQRAATTLRNRWAKREEAAVAQVLDDCDYTKLKRRKIEAMMDLPSGNYCPESNVFGKKCDVPVGLRNGRYLLMECKVSGSEVNSYKRLNHETVNKHGVWVKGFGGQAYSAGVLSGVFRPQNVLEAQEAGVFIYWEHDLGPLAEYLGSIPERGGD